MADKLQGKRIAFLVAPEGVEQVELTEPWKAVESEGGKPELVSTEEGEVQAFNHLDKADTFKVDRTVGRRRARRDYDGLVLPGGVANPDFLRMDEDAVAFVRAFFEQGKPVAAICHGAVDAGRGRRPARPHDHVVAVAADRHPQRRRQLGRRGGRGRRGPRLLAQPGRPAGVLRQARRGVLRGRARGPAPERRLGLVSGRRGDPRHRRHARRHELPPRDRVVPRVPARATSCCRCGGSTATSGWAATSWSPPSRARSSTREHGDDVRAAEKALYMALIGRGAPARGRARAVEDLERRRPRGRARLLGQAGRGRALPRPARRARAGRRLDGLGRRGAHEAGARPRQRGDREGRRRRRR